jgi:RNA recognition motif-containing protein
VVVPQLTHRQSTLRDEGEEAAEPPERAPGRRRRGRITDSTNTVYVGQLPAVSQSEFEGWLREKGLKTQMVSKTRARGFAFVRLVDAAEMNRTIEMLNGAEYCGCRIVCSAAKFRSPVA